MIKRCIIDSCRNEFESVTPNQKCCSLSCVYEHLNSYKTFKVCNVCNEKFKCSGVIRITCKYCLSEAKKKRLKIKFCKLCDIGFKSKVRNKVYCDECSNLESHKRRKLVNQKGTIKNE